MKTMHALNFLLIGLVMCFSPALWPEYFSGDAIRGDASALWMLVMGVTQLALGTWTMGRNEVPRLMLYLAEWEPLTFVFELPDVGWALPESFYATLNDDDYVSVALSLQQQLRLGNA
jgi:hypothetical protein